MGPRGTGIVGACPILARRRLEAVVLVGALGAIGALAACSSDRPQIAAPSVGERYLTEEYLPGLEADVYAPTGRTTGGDPNSATAVSPSSSPTSQASPLVVLIPGGGWVSADRSGLAPLAESLAGAGMTVVSATYRTSADGAYFPDPLDDVACAIAFAAERAAEAFPERLAPHPVVVVGHSAGASLAALAALAQPAPNPPSRPCPYPAVAPDAFAALAGPYNVDDDSEFAISLFGVPQAEDPELWAAGNPLTYAGSRSEVSALLLHGQDDTVVPPSFTTTFAAALEQGGHAVAVDLVAGADHSDIYQPAVAAPRLVDWIGGLD